MEKSLDIYKNRAHGNFYNKTSDYVEKTRANLKKADDIYIDVKKLTVT